MSFGGQLEVLSCTYFGAQRLKIESAHLIEVHCGILRAMSIDHLLTTLHCSLEVADVMSIDRFTVAILDHWWR
jgi:hypothetical protein